MLYITGMIAFGVECKLNTLGKWNLTKQDFTDAKAMELKESQDSPFKDWGIEENKIVPYHEYCTYNVANHVRAYCDLLWEKKFDLLTGMFYECVGDMRSRTDIFTLVNGKLRHLAGFREINEFMEKEFGNAWISYLEAVESISEHLANNDTAIEQLTELQKTMVGQSSRRDLLNAKSIPAIESTDI